MNQIVIIYRLCIQSLYFGTAEKRPQSHPRTKTLQESESAEPLHFEDAWLLKPEEKLAIEPMLILIEELDFTTTSNKKISSEGGYALLGSHQELGNQLIAGLEIGDQGKDEVGDESTMIVEDEGSSMDSDGMDQRLLEGTDESKTYSTDILWSVLHEEQQAAFGMLHNEGDPKPKGSSGQSGINQSIPQANSSQRDGGQENNGQGGGSEKRRSG